MTTFYMRLTGPLGAVSELEEVSARHSEEGEAKVDAMALELASQWCKDIGFVDEPVTIIWDLLDEELDVLASGTVEVEV